MFSVDLPKPSQRLIDTLYDEMKTTLESYVYLWETYPNWPNNFAENVSLHKESNQIGNTEFQSFFDEPIIVCGLLFVPNPNSYVSCLVPHTDSYRNFGINYILETGGENVTTTIYTKKEYGEPKSNQYFGTDLEVLDSRQLLPNHWYGLDGSRYHSVENITSNRLLLSVSFQNLTYEEFVLKYRNIIL